MTYNDARQLPSSSSSQTVSASPPVLPSAPSDGTATSSGGLSGSADPPTSTPLPSTSAQTSLTPSLSPSLTSSAPSIVVPSSTSSSSLLSPSMTLPSSTFVPPPLSLFPTSTSSPQAALESTTSQSTSSSAPTTSFTTIVTTLGDGSVSTTVAPLPTSLQTTPNSNPSNHPNRVGIIAGTTVAVVSFILLLLSLVFCYRKNKLKKLWNSLDLRGGRARERRGLLEDEDFEDDLAHARSRSDMSQGRPFMLGGGSINMSVGSSAGYQVGHSPVLSNASARFIGPAIPITHLPDPARPYSRSSYPISTPSSINSSLPAIHSPLPSQSQNQMPNSNSNYTNYNSSVTSIPHSSPPVPSLFRPRASESGSIFREEGVWPPPNEKSNEFVDPFVGHVKKVSSEVGDELGKIVRDVMGPSSSFGDSGSSSTLSPSPPVSVPITSMTVAALGSMGGVATGLDDRTGSRKHLEDSPTSTRKFTNRHTASTPSPSSSPEPSLSPLSAPPAINNNTYANLSPHGNTALNRRHPSSSSLTLSLPPGAAPPSVVVGPKSKSTTMVSPVGSMSPSTPLRSPTSADTANTANTMNTMNTMNTLTMRSDESSVLYRYNKESGMPKVEEDFGNNSKRRRMSSDGFEFVRGEKVDREVVSHELGILKEEASMNVGGGGRSSSSAMPKRRSTVMSMSSQFSAMGMEESSTTSLVLSPSSSPVLNFSQVKKSSPLKQHTLAD
ncbi:hypothetical protein AGABI2DRAFT_120937 [Agaricus bisporus var. bisporus H97]|uniref:hypothetical protein n=1 Tax=Agaricus bisporus var. bisporus (strain H97 / ATCC MYA-4626 / FGSC 10389) TaxID=936046 RepID=UPI00029F7B2B|nr:hypothetical protein AGABI2DRAFT_120937 [Agaricus bisporus var. bisporus H97]EKV44842.1 hypothetical protein AGABI2DRAFT_120937 [Agaricus bisporus var. bisporus H97]